MTPAVQEYRNLLDTTHPLYYTKSEGIAETTRVMEADPTAAFKPFVVPEPAFYRRYRLTRGRDNVFTVCEDNPVAVHDLTMARRKAVIELGEIQMSDLQL